MANSDSSTLQLSAPVSIKNRAVTGWSGIGLFAESTPPRPGLGSRATSISGPYALDRGKVSVGIGRSGSHRRRRVEPGNTLHEKPAVAELAVSGRQRRLPIVEHVDELGPADEGELAFVLGQQPGKRARMQRRLG